MEILFKKIDSTKMMGLKMLRDSEINRTDSHQTHIGLFEETLPLKSLSIPSLLIYDARSFDTLTITDPITNPDGTVRSPKMRRGRGENEKYHGGVYYESTYDKINELILKYEKHEKRKFYLHWGTLENGRLFFILFTPGDSISKKYEKNIDKSELYSERKKLVTNSLLFSRFQNVAEELISIYLTENDANQDLELIQAGLPPTRFFTVNEISQAHLIGEKGEEIINEYLKFEKKKKIITNFEWISKATPSANHDFERTTNDGVVEMLEVKTTISDFKKPFYWSKNERNLFLSDYVNYRFYRVNKVFENSAALNITKKMHLLFQQLNNSKIEGLQFDKAMISPDEINIDWTESIALKQFK